MVLRVTPKESRPRVATSIKRAILRWFDTNGRKFPWREKGATTYEQVIAEFLLQRTRAETVSAYFSAFTSRFPSWKSLSEATVEEVADSLKPIGLWRRRSVSLTELAKEMTRRGGRFPASRHEVEALPGVGQYIASAIMIFSADQAEPLLDVNMARVLERVFGPRKLVDIRYDPYLQDLARRVVRSSESKRLNWAILDLAALVCTTRAPRCDRCPLKRSCRFFRQSRA
jgi:A/G-specific adenine glycosylase